MWRRGKREEKFEESCNLARLQLFYFDAVNDAGHELTKLSKEAMLSQGPKQSKCEDAIMSFAQSNGIFFYVSLDE